MLSQGERQRERIIVRVESQEERQTDLVSGEKRNLTHFHYPNNLGFLPPPQKKMFSENAPLVSKKRKTIFYT